MKFTVPYRPRTGPAYTLQATTNPVPVLRIYIFHKDLVCSPYKYQPLYILQSTNRHSTSSPYTLQPSRNPVPVRICYSPLQTMFIVLRILYSPPKNITSPYSTLPYRPSTFCVHDKHLIALRILYSPLQNWYQSSVYYTVHYRPSSCPLFTQRKCTDIVPVLCILYNALQTQFQSSVYLQSTTDQVTVLPVLYSPLKTKLQSSLYSTVHFRPSYSPSYNPQSTTDIVSVYRILYSPPQTQYQSCIYSTVPYRWYSL